MIFLSSCEEGAVYCEESMVWNPTSELESGPLGGQLLEALLWLECDKCHGMKKTEESDVKISNHGKPYWKVKFYMLLPFVHHHREKARPVLVK